MYKIKDVFVSLQGEGALSGTPMAFVRFAGCNLQCAIKPGDRSPGGFDCDTDFKGGFVRYRPDEVWAWIKLAADQQRRGFKGHGRVWARTELPKWVIFTGGEPLLQLDATLCRAMVEEYGMKLAVETNGTIPFRKGVEQYLNYITISPKPTNKYAVLLKRCHELRVVRCHGQLLPTTVQPTADQRFVSPAFDDNPITKKKNFDWCIQLVHQNPEWRLSTQQHKVWEVK